MIKELKLYPNFEHLEKYQNIWLYSDPHFADDEMPRIRKNYIGDDEQVKRINSKVGRKDVLIILGDVGDVEYVKRLRGYKILVMGNHDKGATNYQRIVRPACPKCGCVELDERLKPIVADSGEEVGSYLSAKCERCGYEGPKPDFKDVDNGLFDEVYPGVVMLNEKIVLSHEPVSMPFAFNIHGHDHAGKSDDDMHFNAVAEKIDYTPVSLSELIKSGRLRKVQSIHRMAIDRAIDNKCKKGKGKYDKKG